MRNRSWRASVWLMVPWLGACAGLPTGPSLPALPGTGRTMAQFRVDNEQCRAWAGAQAAGVASQRAAQDAVAGAVVTGAAVGALAGAALGGSRSVGAGAATGGIVGAAVGSGAAQEVAGDAQRRFDQAYIQCMYGLGHKVPLWEGMVPSAPRAPEAPALPARGPAPLPPAGTPPAPPPSWR